MDLILVGLNHRTAPIEVRERLAVSNGEMAELLPRLIEGSGASEALVLSTCNRVEVLAARPRSIDPASPLSGPALLSILCEARGGVEPPPAEAFYVRQGDDAVRHIFRLAAGLDSMVLGEPQILGQLRSAYAAASQAGATGRYINKIFHQAFRTGKQVRTETDLGYGSVSVASVAVTLAAKVFGNFSEHTALLVGAGEMAETAARHLCEQGIANLLFVNRSFDKAEQLAMEYDGEAIPFERLLEAAERADVVISSTGAPGLIMTHEEFHKVMDKRHTRPIFLVDIAVPRDIDPEINDHDNAFVYDIDSLERVADQNLARRQAGIPAAETIVEREVASYRRWVENMRVEPLLKQFHERFDNVRRCELLKNRKRFSASEAQDVERLTLAIQKKLLHRPTELLRQCDPETQEGQRTIEIVRELFDLE